MRQVSGGEGLPEADQTVGVHLKVELILLIPTDMGNSLVSQFDQVFRCAAGSGDVIDGECGNVRDETTNSDDRFSQLAKPADFVITNKEGESDDGVNTLAHEEVVEKSFSLLHIVGQAVEGEVITCTNESGFDAVDDLAIKPAVDKRSDDSNIPGTSCGKALGGTRGNKTQSFGRLSNLFCCF